GPATGDCAAWPSGLAVHLPQYHCCGGRSEARIASTRVSRLPDHIIRLAVPAPLKSRIQPRVAGACADLKMILERKWRIRELRSDGRVILAGRFHHLNHLPRLSLVHAAMAQIHARNRMQIADLRHVRDDGKLTATPE